jgi:predicted transcriptional regulator
MAEGHHRKSLQSDPYRKRRIPASAPSDAEGIQARLDELQTELIRKANSKEDYDAIADEIFRLREEKEKADASARSQEDLQNRITELQDFLKDQHNAVTSNSRV